MIKKRAGHAAAAGPEQTCSGNTAQSSTERINLRPSRTRKARTGSRRMWIVPSVVEKYRLTDGCEGRRYRQLGLQSAQDHSPTCRVRVMEARRLEALYAGSRVKETIRDEIGHMSRQGCLRWISTQRWIQQNEMMGVTQISTLACFCKSQVLKCMTLQTLQISVRNICQVTDRCQHIFHGTDSVDSHVTIISCCQRLKYRYSICVVGSCSAFVFCTQLINVRSSA